MVPFIESLSHGGLASPALQDLRTAKSGSVLEAQAAAQDRHGPYRRSQFATCGQAAACRIRMYARGTVAGSLSALRPGGVIAQISRGRKRCGSNGLTVLIAVDEILDGTRIHGHGRSRLSKHVPWARISHRPGSWLILLQSSPGPRPATVRRTLPRDRRNLQLHWSG